MYLCYRFKGMRNNLAMTLRWNNFIVLHYNSPLDTSQQIMSISHITLI